MQITERINTIVPVRRDTRVIIARQVNIKTLFSLDYLVQFAFFSALLDFKTEKFDIFSMKKIIITKFLDYTMNYLLSFAARNNISSLRCSK